MQVVHATWFRYLCQLVLFCFTFAKGLQKIFGRFAGNRSEFPEESGGSKPLGLGGR